MSMEAAREAIVLAGIPCHVENYGHSTPSTWKIVPDGSVADGFEIVSPKLQGNDGLEQIRKVCEAVNRNGARVARDCGFHVHVDARGLNGPTLYNIIKRYAAHESVIDSFMPPSRRAENNRYCGSMAQLLRNLRSPNPADSCRDFLRGWDQDRRYYKVNIAAFLRHGTIEFRHHSGTTLAGKMIPWIIFCINFVESSMVTVRAVAPTTSQAPSTTTTTTFTPREPAHFASLRANSIQRKFFAIAKCLYGSDSYNYVSAPTLANFLECEVEAVPNYISRFRSAFPRFAIGVRRGRGYYLDIWNEDARREFLSFIGIPDAPWQPRERVAAPVATMEAIVPEDRGVFYGLQEEIVSYFRERIVELSN
jgi:hypothetical protein